MLDKEQYMRNVSFLMIDFTKWNIGFSTDEAKIDGFICIKIADETRAFYPLDFCECYLGVSARQADNARFTNGKTDLNKQAKIFVKCKTNTTNIIERYKRYADEFPQLKKYDFDSFMRQLDTAITESKLNVELKLLNSQIETNGIARTTNRSIAFFTGLAGWYYYNQLLVALIPPAESWEYDKSHRVLVLTLIPLPFYLAWTKLNATLKSKQVQLLRWIKKRRTQQNQST